MEPFTTLKHGLLRLLSILLVGLMWLPAVGQDLNQVIKGRVIDQQTKVELIGAHVLVMGTELGVATDQNGNFRLNRVPTGRYNLQVKYIGYETKIIPEIVVGSAKEVVLTVALKESVIQGEEMTVTPAVEKSKALNGMAMVSARSFTVEETQRYAGGFDDPARLASSFAGVTYGNVQDNAIIVRGNAPKGLLWRLEGVEIPNPNHFPDGNVFGGGLVTVFSNQVLTDSDFLTGAFPAEYGNALSGVFDMNMRSGNSDITEYTAQVGVMGIDFATEGPFTKQSNASYLFNYRYSTTGLLSDFNVIDVEQVPRFQDLSLKINMPTRRSGTFSIWGIGSIDDLQEYEEPDSSRWEYNWDRIAFDSRSKMGAVGLNHKFILGKASFMNSTLSFSGEEMRFDMDRLDNDLVMQDNELINSSRGKVSLRSDLSHKFSPRLNSKAGLAFNYLLYDINLFSTIDEAPDTYQPFVRQSGSSQHLQAFMQTQYRITSGLDLSGGLHYQQLMLNNNYSIEPRVGISWSMHERHTLSVGYGKHSQIEDLQYYLAQRESGQGLVTPNKNLEFTKAHHYVLGYDLQLTSNTRFKVEPYYQYLYDVPVRDGTSFSFLNLRDDRYINEPLINEGTGENIGVDLTLEQFLKDGFYYLITGSVFDSKYTGGDGIERDTRYNRRYVINALAGKEFKVRGNNVLGVNGRFTYMGGERTHAVLQDSSIVMQQRVEDETRAFSEALGGSRYLDLTISYRMNHSRAAHIIRLQVKNLLGSENDYGYVYNYRTKTMEKDMVVLVLPSISYKVQF